jgi:hypothetical protein
MANDPKSKSPGPKPRPDAAPAPDEPKKSTGRVQFDDRGNAVWEWSVSTGAFGRDVSTARLKKLEIPGLSLADDDAKTAAKGKASNPGAGGGYNPYESAEPSKPRGTPPRVTPGDKKKK